MSDPVWVALIALAGGGGLTYLTAAQVRTRRRIERAERSNHALWAYTRSLIDQVYRLGGIPTEPPNYVAHLYGEETTE